MNQSSRVKDLSSERITITLKTARNEGKGEEVELPLKMLVIGNFQGEIDDIPLHERIPVNIDKSRFSTVMYETAPRLKATVTNHLFHETKDKKPSELVLDVCFRSMDDFHPDHIIRQVPSLDRLFKLRELLIDLKCFPDRSQHILDQIADLAMKNSRTENASQKK